MVDKRIRIIFDSTTAEARAKKLDKSFLQIKTSVDAANYSVKKLASSINSALNTSKINQYSTALQKVETQLNQTASSAEILNSATLATTRIVSENRIKTQESATSYSVLRSTIEQTRLSNAALSSSFLASSKSQSLNTTETNAAALANRNLNTSLANTQKAASNSIFSVNKLAAAITGIIIVDKIVRYSNAWKKVENQLRQATKSSEDLNNVTASVLEVSNDSRTALTETANLYARFRLNIDETTLSNERLLDVISTINKSLTLSGATAQESEGALRQLAQAIGEGALRGDEFNSVAEQAPAILKAVSVATGKNVGELRKLAAQGKITAELLISSLENYKETVDEAFKNTEISVGSALIVANNNITLFIGKLDEASGASNSFAKAIIATTSALGDTKAIETILTVLEGLVVVLGGKLIGALTLATVATVKQAAAQLAATEAVVTTTAATSVYTGAVTRTITVVEGMTVANKLMAVSARAGASALALLGGPVGILAIAATALIYYTSKADDAANATDILSKSTENLTKVQADAQKLDAAKALREQEQAAIDAKEKIESLEQTLANLAAPKKFAEQGGSLFGSGGTAEVLNAQKIKAANEELIKTRLTFEEATTKAAQLQERVSKLNDVIAGEEPKKKAIISLDESAVGEQEIKNAQAVTLALQNELAIRTESARIYRETTLNEDASLYEKQLGQIQIRENEALAQVQARAAAEEQRRQEELFRLLESDKITKEQQLILQQEFDAQTVLNEQILNEERTQIHQEGVNARMELDRAEYNSRLAMVGALGDQIMNISKNKSKGIFKIGQALSLAQAAAALPSAVLQSYQNGGGYPYGLIPAGLMLATGISQIQAIRNAGKGLGGGGGPSVSLPSVSGGGGGGASIPTTAAEVQQQQQKRIIDLRGVASTDKLTVAQFAELMEQDGAIVTLENARYDAERRGVSGVTGR